MIHAINAISISTNEYEREFSEMHLDCSKNFHVDPIKNLFVCVSKNSSNFDPLFGVRSLMTNDASFYNRQKVEQDHKENM